MTLFLIHALDRRPAIVFDHRYSRLPIVAYDLLAMVLLTTLARQSPVPPVRDSSHQLELLEIPGAANRFP